MKKIRWTTTACGLVACAFLIYGHALKQSRKSSRDAVAAGVEDAPAAWQTNPDQALTIAQSSNRDTLMVFEGPGAADDTPTHRASLFDASEFRQRAGRRFVLLRLASSPDAPPDQAVQVSTWGQRLGVSQFPSVALIDAQRRPYAMTSMKSKDMAEAFETLDNLEQVKIKRDEAFLMARAAEGINRARFLDTGLEFVKPVAGESYVDIMRQILVLDADNAAGLRAKYQSTVSEIDINHAIQADVYPLIDKGNLAGALGRIDRLISESSASPEQRQLLMAFKGQLYFSLHDTQNAARSFDDAIRIAPNSDAAAKVLAAKAQILGSPS